MLATQQTCSMIFFPSTKYDKWKPAFRLTKRYLVSGWATKSASVRTTLYTNFCAHVTPFACTLHAWS